jgi:hypothetical protein
MIRFQAIRRRREHRRGVAIVESAIVLSTALLLILGILDLGIAVLQYNSLSAAARLLARTAAIHGSRSGPELTPWGATAYSALADDSSEIAAAVQPALFSMKPHMVMVQVSWPDGDNQADHRVQVSVRYQHVSLLPLAGYGTAWNLSAASTMLIAH